MDEGNIGIYNILKKYLRVQELLSNLREHLRGPEEQQRLYMVKSIVSEAKQYLRSRNHKGYLSIS